MDGNVVCFTVIVRDGWQWGLFYCYISTTRVKQRPRHNNDIKQRPRHNNDNNDNNVFVFAHQKSDRVSGGAAGRANRALRRRTVRGCSHTYHTTHTTLHCCWRQAFKSLGRLQPYCRHFSPDCFLMTLIAEIKDLSACAAWSPCREATDFFVTGTKVRPTAAGCRHCQGRSGQSLCRPLLPLCRL